MPYLTVSDDALMITAELWTSAPSATIMLELLSQLNLRHPHKFLPYNQHFRLFSASCARRTGHLLIDKRSRIAIETAELFANGCASASTMQEAHTNAEAAIQEHADRYKSLSSIEQRSALHPTGVDEQILHGAAVLHAAAAAITCCSPNNTITPLRGATACAKYTSRALYWEQLALGADTTLISELLDAEAQRQAHTLRIFLGNPFAPQTFPHMNLHSSTSMLQEGSGTQYYVNAA